MISNTCDCYIFDKETFKLVKCINYATKRYFVKHLMKAFHMCNSCHINRKESAINFKG